MDKILDNLTAIKNDTTQIDMAMLRQLSAIAQNTDTNIFEFVIINNLITEDQILNIICAEYKLDLLKSKQISQYYVQHYALQDEYCKKKYLICIDKNQAHTLVANIYDPAQIDLLKQKFPHCVLKIINRKNFFSLINQSFGTLNIMKAKYLIDLCTNNTSAKHINYALHILLTGICISIAYQFFSAAVGIFAHILYLSHGTLKLVLLKVATLKYRFYPNKIYYDVTIFPFYTILIPLYKEVEKVGDIVQAIEMLHYPKHRLEVKIIIEEDDVYTTLALATMNLKYYFHVVKVPQALPKTKPKALNYAINYATGDYIVVYDAEDLPEPEQLSKAVYYFQTLPSEYKCIQAKVNFYNRNENLLTKLMSMEYSLWFDFLLPGLNCLDLPVTLGGTSNHFHAPTLRSLGNWDAYNVTEDADLGIRIYIASFKTLVIDSYTYGESVNSITAWFYQRSRWIKGFIQTGYVFLSYSKSTRQSLGIKGQVGVIIFLLFTPLAFLILPLLFICTLLSHNTVFELVLNYNIFFALTYTYIASFTVLKKAINNRIVSITMQDVICFIISPLYFILHIIASYIAIFELCCRPFKWNKTKHGVSKINN